MRRSIPICAVWCAAGLVGCSASGTRPADPAPAPTRDGLDGESRAGQALSRLTFGSRPGDLAAIERAGYDAWLEQQLHPERISDRAADSVLALLETQGKRAYQLVADHPPPEELNQRTALEAGRQKMEDGAPSRVRGAVDSAALRHAQQTAQALTTQIVTAKVLRATLSER